MLLTITVKAGTLVALDEFTTKFWKIEFARVRIELDSLVPLKPGVLIYGQ